MTKKIVLWVSVILNVLLLSLAYIQSGEICYSKDWCNKLWDSINITGEILFVFIPIFLLSLITYKMHEEVFRAWWNFARWFVPIIMLVTFLLNSAHRGGGIAGAAAGGFNILILGIFYVIFVITSLVKIAGAYRKNK